MRSFSNIMPNFADKLHLLVDSIGDSNPPLFCIFIEKNEPYFNFNPYLCNLFKMDKTT